ncbi:hypothetical protein HanPSC8_Chr05g0188541 [Helianthus annuus]|nr:hypothetical protein HanPSC8_Chr05g0188541 [Helianthus annuus]
MPFLAKPAWPVVSEHLRHMFLSVALWLAVFTVFIFVCGWFSNLGFLDLVVTDDDEVILIWEFLLVSSMMMKLRSRYKNRLLDMDGDEIGLFLGSMMMKHSLSERN